LKPALDSGGVERRRVVHREQRGAPPRPP